ncbi:MAG: choice-of-anchor D domain-containing protein [Acidobacteriales bacterium]|nr:choice-of-anchor D domain-containing protein [Terriglobales bacterium]
MRLRRFAVLSLFLAVAGSAASASDSVQLHSGLWRGRVVTYQVSHGQPRLEGDILLDHIQQSPLPVSGEGATTSYLSYLWPKVGSVYQIPYVIDPASGGVSNINAAIAQSNATFPGVLQWVAHTTETDYVNINLNSGDFSGVCESAVGRIGGEQMLTGSAACAVSTLLHEMGHTVGLYHEQSRSDRDAYVSVNYNNVIKGSRANFDKVTDNVQNLTLYDYASVMGYIPFAFSRNGGPTLESIPPGMPLSNLVGYSAGAQSHSVTLPATTTSYTASLTPQFYVTDYTNQFCAGSISVTPSSSDGYYNSGQILTFDQTTSTGWTFTGWLYDLNGTGDPQNLTVADEVLAVADYNTSPVQLSLTSLSPAAAVAGAATQTLTMKGTGFSSSSTIVFVNGVFRPSTFVDANTLTLSLTAADLATPGAIQIFVESFPSGASCAAFAATPFFVASAPLVKPTPASLSFSPQVVATASASKAITLKNTGVSTVTLNALSASGNFAQTNTCGSSLAAGASCTVNVTFTPVTSGAITGAITVSDSSPDSPQVIALTGTGQTPLTIAPATLSFGAVTVGHTSPAKTVTLTNNQTKTLNFSFSASGNYTAVGGGTPPCSTTLAAKAKCSISVTFKPTANGSINGAVTISHDAVFTPQEVALTGSGSGGASSPLTFTPATLTFPSQVVGTGASRNVTVKNVSTASLTISSLTASGNYAAVGSGAKPCNGLLAAGATCTMSVTFTPSLNGTIKGAVVVTDTAPVNQQVLNVSGTAVLPVSLSPTSLTFAAQTVGTASASQTVTLTNNQSTTLTITAITGSGDYTAVPGGLSPCGTTVAAKGSCTFTVSFTPSAVGTIVGAATVSHNAAFNPTIVATTGTGQ